MESPVYPQILNTKGTDATVIGSDVIKNTVKALTARRPSRMDYLEFIVLGQSPRMHYEALNRYLG